MLKRARIHNSDAKSVHGAGRAFDDMLVKLVNDLKNGLSIFPLVTTLLRLLRSVASAIIRR